VRKFIILLISVLLLSLTGCTKPSTDALRFKEEYETWESDIAITIPEDNPFVFSDFEEVVDKMKNGESFILYCGSNWCPWCRDVLPVFIECTKEHNIKKVLYVDVNPGQVNEKRNAYQLDENGKVYRSNEGTKGYNEFIKLAANVLRNYRNGTITLDGTEWEGEKRVGAPNFIVVIDGEAVAMTSGISDLLKSAHDEITPEIREDIKSLIENALSKWN